MANSQDSIACLIAVHCYIYPGLGTDSTV